MKIEVVWRQLRWKKLKTPAEAKAFIKTLPDDAEDVIVYEVDGDTTTAYYEFGDDHLKPNSFKRVEMDG